MTGLLKRLINTAIGEDEAANALLGGSAKETLSGSVGRARQRGKWWAPAAQTLIDGLFGKGHCQREAAKEAAARNWD